MMYHTDMESSISFWINPIILVGVTTLLWRSQVRKFDQISKRFDQVDKRFERTDRQLREINREVVTNGKSIARMVGRHEGHPHDMATVE